VKLRKLPTHATGSGDDDGDGEVGDPVGSDDALGRSTPGGKGSEWAAMYAPTPAHARKTAAHAATLMPRRISGGRGA
jgi:hypothetical protein